MLSYQVDEDPGEHVTIVLEDTKQVLKVNKKFIEKVTTGCPYIYLRLAVLNTIIKV